MKFIASSVALVACASAQSLGQNPGYVLEASSFCITNYTNHSTIGFGAENQLTGQ